jgi:hypothetical protein
MADKQKIPDEVEAIAKQAWDSGHRIAMQVASLPLEQREAALQHAEKVLAETADQFSATPAQRDGWVKIQMELIRGVVKKLEASGSPQGGRA